MLGIGNIVTHARHGEGEVLVARGETAVVRFSHGLEELRVTELQRTVSLVSALGTGEVSAMDELLLRSQSALIRSVNDAWGVFSRSRIALLPHQLWVCHRALRQWPIRLLIADDVGMGKTIEAGLILWPLLARGSIRRLLVLTPAKLVEQWQFRLRQMFDIRLAIYSPDTDSLRTDFWNTHPMVVASLPTLKADSNGRHERLLDAPGWDMVIVDEAHHLHADENGTKTLGLQLLEKLQSAGKIDSCLLFTGTPHRGKDYGFWALMSLLDSGVFGPKKDAEPMLQALPEFLIRNAKQKVVDMTGKPLFQPVRQYPETFRYTPEEEAFYRLMSSFIMAGKAYASSLSSAQGGQVMLVLIALQKLASSSIAAVSAALATRRARMAGLANQYRLELEQETDDPQADDIEKALRNWAREDRRGKIQLMEDEAQYLDDLLLAARAVTSETRVQRVVEVIKSRFPGQSVLLFTEYKRTQALVVSALMEHFGARCVGFINGEDRLDGVQSPEGKTLTLHARREDAAAAFNAGRIRFLVSTEAGGEGIDLQECCSALIHVDLPWNPMRLHQRVGRLNRYGQKRPVEVVSLRNPDTVEAMIWDKLERKLGSIMQALGSAMDEPEDLLQLVLGMSAPSLFNEMFSQAPEVPKARLAQWFDEKTKTFGGESAITTVKTLVGHAQSFDLSGLQDVPPLDLPDLKPFFLASLSFNNRRPKAEGDSVSFKTPEKWLTSPTIKREYDELIFERDSQLKADLIGVGHPLLAQAMDQADRLQAVFAAVHGLQEPILLLLATDRVTDGGAFVRKTVIGVTRCDGAIHPLRDWEVLRLLNSKSFVQANDSLPLTAAQDIANWVEQAKTVVRNRLAEFNLPFAVPELREYVLWWPA